MSGDLGPIAGRLRGRGLAGAEPDDAQGIGDELPLELARTKDGQAGLS